MKSKFEAFPKNKMYELHITEIIGTDWPHTLNEYWYQVYTPYLGDFYFYPEWLFQYYNEIPIGEYIESYYLTWNP